MIPIPSGVTGVAGDRPHRHAARQGVASARGAAARSACWRSLRFRGKSSHLIKVLGHDGIGAGATP
jgi:hypothetical protein